MRQGRRKTTKTTDLYLLAESSDTEVICFDLPSTHSVSVMAESGRCYIGMDPFAIETEAEERVHLAHELGHCKTGTFYSLDSPLETRERLEIRADRWAIRTLIPADELNVVLGLVNEAWALAEYFGVTEEFMLKAIEYYRLTGKI